jgi:hypothetical protein
VSRSTMKKRMWRCRTRDLETEISFSSRMFDISLHWDWSTALSCPWAWEWRFQHEIGIVRTKVHCHLFVSV